MLALLLIPLGAVVLLTVANFVTRRTTRTVERTGQAVGVTATPQAVTGRASATASLRGYHYTRSSTALSLSRLRPCSNKS